MTFYIEGLLAKARWRQELNKRGYEGRLPVASERLSETLRAELRAILDNNGKPFDLQVARHVYDFAIAAKDLLTVSVSSVEEAMKVVADNQGAMESLTGPSDPPPPEVASETFGARVLRELLAVMPSFLPSAKTLEDSRVLVAAIADARERGLSDLAARLEHKLMGTPLELPKITRAEVVQDSYEHGFLDGSMQDNFDRGVVNGCVGIDRKDWTPAYREGYEAGRARRLAKACTCEATMRQVEDADRRVPCLVHGTTAWDQPQLGLAAGRCTAQSAIGGVRCALAAGHPQASHENTGITWCDPQPRSTLALANSQSAVEVES